MDPIEKLVGEHRNILAVLASFERFAAKMMSEGVCDLARLGQFTEFIREYADKYHHSKEEDILFVAMEENGFSSRTGPVAMMLYEHEEGRKYVKFLLEASQENRELSEDERQAVANAIRGYCELLRAHIYKEDNILYPMAGQHIPREAYRSMSARFAEVEESSAATGRVTGLERLGLELASL